MRRLTHCAVPLALAAAGLAANGILTPRAAAADAAPAACSTVYQAEQSARSRLDALFAAIADQKPARARSLLALHRGGHPERYRATLVIWHAGKGDNRSHHEIFYRAQSGDDRAFDAWVRKRRRQFVAVVVDGDHVRSGSIGLAVTVDLSEGRRTFRYSGKAVFDCLQNRYVFLQFGR